MVTGVNIFIYPVLNIDGTGIKRRYYIRYFITADQPQAKVEQQEAGNNSVEE